MATRSEFQGAALYFSATTLAASMLLGNEGLNLSEWLQLARDTFGAAIPENVDGLDDLNSVSDVQDAATNVDLRELLPPQWAATVPEEINGWVEKARDLMMAFGWSLGALGAALWRRLQSIALGGLGVASFESVRESLSAGLANGGEHAIAATILQLVALAAAGLGLTSKGRNIFRRTPTPGFDPKMLKPREALPKRSLRWSV